MLIKHRRAIELEVREDRNATGTRESAVSSQSNPDFSHTSKLLTVDDQPTKPEDALSFEDYTESYRLQAVLSYVEDHIDNDERIGRALRRVACKGTPGQIYEFVGKLIDLLRQAHSRPAAHPRGRPPIR